jgi:hypothetical protein
MGWGGGYQYEGASGPLIKVCGVSMDVSFQGGSNETVGGCVRLRRSELLSIKLKVVLAASGASDQQVWSVYECIFSLRFQ